MYLGPQFQPLPQPGIHPGDQAHGKNCGWHAVSLQADASFLWRYTGKSVPLAFFSIINWIRSTMCAPASTAGVPPR